MDRGRILALDSAENLKRIYGESKAIEILLAPMNGARPSYEELFASLINLYPDLVVSRQPDDSNPAIIVSKHPESVIGTIVSLTTERKLKLEWLNIRKSTLEDVFIKTVSRVDDQSGAGTGK